jgi:hypothetical protein
VGHFSSHRFSYVFEISVPPIRAISKPDRSSLETWDPDPTRRAKLRTRGEPRAAGNAVAHTPPRHNARGRTTVVGVGDPDVEVTTPVCLAYHRPHLSSRAAATGAERSAEGRMAGAVGTQGEGTRARDRGGGWRRDGAPITGRRLRPCPLLAPTLAESTIQFNSIGSPPNRRPGRHCSCRSEPARRS